MKSTRRNAFLKLVIMLAVTTVLILLCRAFVPYNVDEFIHYRYVFCHHFLANRQEYLRADCGTYDLNLLNTGLILPMRSFDYSGSFPSFYYYPVFLLWSGLASVRWMGTLFLMMQSYLLWKIFPRFSPFVIFAGLLLFFPYSYQHLMDTGPVSFQITSVYALYFLFRRWAHSFHFVFLLAGVIIIFLGFWTKITYLWLLPGIAILFLLALVEKGSVRAMHAHKRQLAVSIFLLLLICGALIVSTSPHAPGLMPLLIQLERGKVYSWSEFRTVFWHLPVMSAYFHPLQALQRSFIVPSFPLLSAAYSTLLYGMVPFFLAFCLFFSPRRWKGPFYATVLYAAFVCTILLIARTKMAWAMHHAILAFPFLVLSILKITDSVLVLLSKHALPRLRALGNAYIGLFAGLNLCLYVLVPFQTNRSMNVVATAEAREAVAATAPVHVASGGHIYTCHTLCGGVSKDVLYAGTLRDDWQIGAVQKFSLLHHRRILFQYGKHEPQRDLNFVETSFSIVDCYKIPDASLLQYLNATVQ